MQPTSLAQPKLRLFLRNRDLYAYMALTFGGNLAVSDQANRQI